MAFYRDLREYIGALEASGKLVRIREPVNKDTQLHPLTRLQFRGLPETERKAFLFENVFDSKGWKYNIPVLVGARKEGGAADRPPHDAGQVGGERRTFHQLLLQPDLHPVPG